jgi:predicted deacylase
LPGESKTIDMEIAKLHNTRTENSIIVRRSKIDGPVVLFSAGIHGDEIMVLRLYDNLSLKKLINLRGTIICIPVIMFLVSLIKVESFLMAET